MENETVKIAVKNQYNFVNETKTYYQVIMEKIQKLL